VGVMAIALFILLSSGWVLRQALALHAARRAHNFFMASVVLSILALLAAESLWMLRPYAFFMFTLWSVMAVAALALYHLAPGSGGHLIRLFGPIACCGLIYALTALYLRRVV
jgi:hypothetical protein